MLGLVTELHDPYVKALVDEHLRRMGERIAELRALQGLTLTMFEEYSGIDSRQLSKIERGMRNISIRTAVRIADALGVQLHELFVPRELSEIRVKSKARHERKGREPQKKTSKKTRKRKTG